MATTPKPLFDPQQLTTSAATYYTVPAGSTAIIKHLAVDNTTANNVTCTIYLVPSGGTAGVSNRIFSETIPAGRSKLIVSAINATLESSATIQALAGAVTSITFHGGGNEVTV